jgi:hypothetical protein
MELVKRFPQSSQAAMALSELASHAPTASDKLHYLEMLKDDHFPAAAPFKVGGMLTLFGIYEQTDRTKAVALVKEMINGGSSASLWRPRLGYAQAIQDADQFLKEGKPNDALNVLSKISVRDSFMRQLALLRARALDASGNKQDAYNTLLEDCAIVPTDETRALLMQYGQELGKNDHQIAEELRLLLVKNSRPAAPFSLPTYTGHGPIPLDDLRGHVTLLNFWYPRVRSVPW